MDVNAAFREDLSRSVLCWLATVTADGAPNVTPKEIFCLDGEDRMLIADIMSAGSVRNVRANPEVCVSFIDVFVQRGFKVTGRARIVGPGEDGFEALAAPLRAKGGPDFPVRNVIEVWIRRIERIWAPSFSLVPGRTDAERIAGALEAYGVRSRDRAVD